MFQKVTWANQGFQTPFDFFPERSPSIRNAFYRICIDSLHKIILVVSESGFVRMNIRNILKEIVIDFVQSTMM